MSVPTSTMMDTPGATPPMEAGETVTGALIVKLKHVSDLGAVHKLRHHILEGSGPYT